MQKQAPEEKLVKAIQNAFISGSEENSDRGPANIVDGLYRLADAMDGLNRAIRLLGNADAATSFGGMEALGMALEKTGETIQSGLGDLADAIREHKES